jgi:hypothetical protein
VPIGPRGSVEGVLGQMHSSINSDICEVGIDHTNQKHHTIRPACTLVDGRSPDLVSWCFWSGVGKAGDEEGEEAEQTLDHSNSMCPGYALQNRDVVSEN